jgi:uncharacterized protein YbbK (DUF523 family)
MFLVSKCCVGIECRYNQTGFFHKSLAALGKTEDYVAVCPEALGGLPTPREGCSVRQGKLTPDGFNDGKVIGRQTGRDYTPFFTLGAEKTLEICKQLGVKKAYLLKKSPSCGKGYGLTARLLDRHNIEVIPI